MCPKVNAVPTFTVFASPSIVVELEPKVTTPTKVDCPFVSIVTPAPIFIPFSLVSNFLTLLKYKS